ncbi:hypothetical protein P152DRAFT_44213 [Eremomyces bilateralis CBS 781.70]|uniref:C2H2-type domain-containing protein n=1 Tax=Eremomyces bilateralis CBS 781.70 TaxID=1392243 RepID=A0A6G1G2D2_9PEZI|nr:uncharacterized protein P152DRAFT_44213 [Eremomyces bilateralis CBS 781.70]KAF1812081.1 hypothetical protein P152DRAFT_44213 [Eremomyces bilateralis CBS 781.70]
MAAVVAPHGGTWQERRMSYNMLHMPSSTMAFSSYDLGSRSATAVPNSQPFPFDMSMRTFTTGMNSSIPMHQTAYGIEAMGVHQYSMPPSYVSMPASTAHTHAVSYQTASDISTGVPRIPEVRNGAAIHQPIKVEMESPIQSPQMLKDSLMATEMSGADSVNAETGINFSTDVDTLMRTIQSKTETAARASSERAGLVNGFEAVNSQNESRSYPQHQKKMGRATGKARKKYVCRIPGCDKLFSQKTHLDIHTRAHTGFKPFICKEPSCGQRFTQLGNLKTHERRHTGERPYSCEECGKTFAQRGNVRAHQIVHLQIKPFTCLLDDCGKQFTQLGNLKSHQNKFHSATLRFLAHKFSSIREGDPVTAQDKDLWEYFARLYRNSNKGIKGRGKHRRIATTSPEFHSSSSPPASASSNASYGASTGPSSVDSASANAKHERGSRDSSLVSEQGHHNLTMQRQGSLHGMHHHHINPNIRTDEHFGFDGANVEYGDLVFPERKMF